MKLPTMKKLREILDPLKEKYEIILFGSSVEGGMRPTSDIDVAILTRNKNKAENIQLQKDILGVYPQKFDIRIFELFPIYIQISIIENYKVIFGDPLEISEYFYYFRKKWDDCKHRILSNQFSSYRERLSLMK
ncbi:MAG: nucleotidyltransferase domain-containing protein [Promethearchaeota archaeon]